MTPYVDRAYSAQVYSQGSEEEEEDVLAVEFAGKLANELLKHERQVEWIAELFRDAIRDIVAKRATKKGKVYKGGEAMHVRKSRIPLDEVVDVIQMPTFDSNTAEAELYAVKIPENVSKLIREFVSIVSLKRARVQCIFGLTTLTFVLFQSKIFVNPK